MRRLLDALLTTDAAQRARLVQAAVVGLALGVAGLALLLQVVAGAVPARPVLVWWLLAPGSLALLFVAVRSGWSRRLADPTLTMALLCVGALGAAVAYALSGPSRGGVLLVMMVVLMAAMPTATPGQVRAGTALSLLALGLALAWRAWQAPGWPWTETVHALLAAVLLPVASLLTTRLAAVRARSRRQQQDLEAALSRIRELATRDELTGLVNRRHMRDLMEQEHQRCIRSGRGFCLAVLDIDGFKHINEQHGRSIGDAVLRSVAHEAMRRVRVSDAFARWGGDRFVLLMSDTRGTLARGGAERVRSGIGSMHLAVPGGELRITLSAGLAEHHAGETVEQTLDRAERALDDAKAQGRDRLVAGT